MKRYLLLVIPLLFSMSAFAQSIKIGFFEVAPYVYKETGSKQMKGATVEFLEQKIGPAMGVKFEWAKDATSIPRQLEQLKNNQLDAAAVFAKNPEREKILAYPPHPYFKSNPVLAVLKSNSLARIEKVEDVLGLKVGHCAKSFISPFMRDKRIKWDFLSNSNCIDLNMQKLVKKRFDAQYQPDAPPLLYYARKNQVENEIRLVPLPEDVNIYMPFSKAAGAKYIDRYNKAFNDVGGLKAYLSFLAKYIDISRL